MGEDEVLVIGAGASGAALAWRLAVAGLKVTCLEQGDVVSYGDVPTLGVDWELARETTHHPNPNIRGRPEDYPVADANSPIKPLMYNGVGGSTVLWGAHVPRFRPSDFRVRSLDGVADDWPLDYDELAPYYDLNDRIMGVAGLAGDPGNPPRPARAMPPVPPGRAAELLGAAFDRLGWHWWVVDAAINTHAHGLGRGVCNHCGPCNLGCPQKARASADVAYWPLAIEAGVQLVTRARAFEIETDGTGRVTGVAYYDSDGIARRRRAVVVLAANGIGTPRLLLLSSSKRHPDGLANHTGMVGCRLMFHPTAMVTGVFAQRVDGHVGPIGASILCQHFYETEPTRGFVRGYQMQLLRSYGPLGTATGGFLPPLPWGDRHHRRFLETFGHSASLTVTTEDLPCESNRVTLDADLADGVGIAAPRIAYRLGPNTKAMIAHGIARASEAFRTAGADDVVVQPLVAQAGFHLMGTARMGNDPDRSVVDRFGRAHDLENLFVVDGSVFVTAAAVNPTPTIQALALRSADHIVATRRELGRKRRVKKHLDAALDAMIPGGDGFPSAVSLDLGRALLAGGAQATAQAFLDILPDDLAAEPRSTRTALLEALEQREAATFAAFVLAAYRAYYSSPAVVGAIEDLTGHAARPPQPLGYAVPPFDESLLAVPKQRAPHYRRP